MDTWTISFVCHTENELFHLDLNGLKANSCSCTNYDAVRVTNVDKQMSPGCSPHDYQNDENIIATIKYSGTFWAVQIMLNIQYINSK